MKLIASEAITMDRQDNANTVIVNDENFDKELLQSDTRSSSTFGRSGADSAR